MEWEICKDARVQMAYALKMMRRFRRAHVVLINGRGILQIFLMDPSAGKNNVGRHVARKPFQQLISKTKWGLALILPTRGSRVSIRLHQFCDFKPFNAITNTFYLKQLFNTGNSCSVNCIRFYCVIFSKTPRTKIFMYTVPFCCQWKITFV